MTARIAPQLTDTDRLTIAKARAMAEFVPMAVIRERTGNAGDTTMALVDELASVRVLLGQVADLADRLGGDGA